MKAAAIVSSSQQITNYYKFAETASANTTFYGSVTANSGLINGTTDAFFDLNRSASGNASRVRFQTIGTDEFEIGLKGGVPGFHITKGDATELVTVLSDGGVDFVGSPTASIFKIKTAGGGIDFGINTGGAGKSSQLLDDYEEGSLTGTITCGTSGTVTLDAGYNTLSYTKIGSIVHVFGLLSVTSVSSPVGYFTIPLPFACANLGDSAATSAATIIVNGTNTTNTSDFVGWAEETQSSIVVRRGDATGVQNTSANELKALTDIYIQFTYRAN